LGKLWIDYDRKEREHVNEIVRAIDVGYRLCKYVANERDRQIECGSFPSIAPVASGRDLAEALGRKRKTVVVEVNGLSYEVGPEAELATGEFQVRNLDNNYTESDEYMALVYGSIELMKVEAIDLLVVGLPVSLVMQKKALLAKRLKKKHKLADGKVVEVKDVRVLAQPMGALMSYAAETGRRAAGEKQRNLIVDCGGRTFDWLVAEGLKVIESRSDAVPLGMYQVTQVIGRWISQRLGTQFNDYERIETGLRFGKSPIVFGEEFSVEEIMPKAKKIAQDAVTAMRQKIQDGSDIDNIILAGGSAFFYKPALADAFPRHKIHEMHESVYANVRGFQIAGMELIAAQRRRKQREDAKEKVL
jgi:plasmid segregation protein ParM